jgi:hypothetical protein
MATIDLNDPEELDKVWREFSASLLRVADQKIRGKLRRVLGADDVVASVFKSFLRDAQSNKLPPLQDEDHLWRVLVLKISRKVIERWRHETRKKRGGGHVVDEAGLLGSTRDDTVPLADLALDTSCDYDALLDELLQPLQTDLQREVARRLFHGESRAEIIAALQAKDSSVSDARVDRTLRLIRDIWGRDWS